MGEVASVQVWSTESVEPRHRLGYWLDAICDYFLEMNASPHPGDGFFGRIEVCPLRHLTPTAATGSAQTVRRDRVAIARSQWDSYYLISQPRRAWRIAHAGHDGVVQPGESVLVDSRLPYQFDFANGLENLSVALPIDWVERWLPRPSKVLGVPLQGQTGWGLALRGMCEALSPAAVPSLPALPEAIEEQLGLLLGLASHQLEAEPGRAHSIVSRCEMRMRERLADPALVAADVAKAAGTSLRNLHRAFAGQNRSFAGSLLAMRIAEADRMLSDVRFERVTIGEISRRCGFLDPSHFTRQFRRLRGVYPKQLRPK